MKDNTHKFRQDFTIGQKLLYAALLLAVAAVAVLVILSATNRETVKETKDTTHGIDVARYQGTIDWAEAAKSGIDFAMVRIGYRSMSDGTIQADPNGLYNLQEAAKQGIRLGAYFFSTAVNSGEAEEEANWVADQIDQYPITYPVAFDCENFEDPDSRQYGLSKEERTDYALKFLETIEKRGYAGMFYASKRQMEFGNEWEIHRLVGKYKIWVAQYPENPDPFFGQSSYEGLHHMWQYTMEGSVPGIETFVDRDVAYFGYDGVKEPKSKTAPAEVSPNPEAMLNFKTVDEIVTAKSETNLRSIPSQDGDSQVLYTLQNGEQAHRIAVSANGWSKLEFNGAVYYAVSGYLTTDLEAPVSVPEDENVRTKFTPVNEQVTPKEAVNLRTIPSVTNGESEIVCQIQNGEVITRIGVNEDVGWSRVEYQGRILYCVSSLLETVNP